MLKVTGKEFFDAIENTWRDKKGGTKNRPNTTTTYLDVNGITVGVLVSLKAGLEKHYYLPQSNKTS